MDPDSEFVFELQVCQWAERDWPPERARPRPILIARQLGTKRRRWDTIVIECDPDALETRARFGRKRLDSDLLDVLRHAPEEWAWYRDALPDPGYPWRYVRESIHRADDREILETRTRGNRLQIRRRWAYPDWVERIVAIENKPDFDASAARALTDQLQRDVAVGLADEVWVATAGGREQFERALLEDVPVEVGILLVEGRDAEAVWQPRSLSPDQPGTRIEQRPDGGERDASAARFSYVDPDWKREKRLAIAERAYERGFRSYVKTMRPDCRHFELDDVPAGFLPHCDAKSCHQTASECRGGCPEYEPEPPTWRTGGWPIDGGPGAGIRRLLERQRLRTRPGLDE
ncbi:DUF5787 family protein [Halapricum desulfuricans]|uniref:Uncharacterized protein n=1 Tax=Halapricum desulfuricans TaxID=2841257 RepID=A0A897MT32_9EURY|nr:DUF5787 family protein [Halapricum desulfuricans]QSG05290.1 Uncharacterized protein HSR121_0941 [Halapricum desulfuricans]